MTEPKRCCEKCEQTRQIKGEEYTDCCYPGCPCHTPVSNYERVSHTHCWDNQPSPCGIPLDKHTQCCLCDLKVPVSEPTLQEKIEAMLRNSHNYGEITCGYDELARDLLALVEGEKVKCICENLYPRGKVHYRDCPATTPTPPPTEGWKMKLADLLVRFGVAVEYPHLEKAIWDFTTQALAEQKALHDKHCKEQYDLGHAHGVEIERARMVEVVANAPTFTKHVYALTGKGVEDTVYVDRDFIIKALSK